MVERASYPGGNPAPAFSHPAAPTAANADSVLHQIRHALAALLDWGEETAIDLSSLPFGPADLARLEEALGEGEVSAAVEAHGSSRIRETGIPGVWRIEHLGPEGNVRSRFIEVTWIPAILKADPVDAADGLRRLDGRLADISEERKPS